MASKVNEIIHLSAPHFSTALNVAQGRYKTNEVGGRLQNLRVLLYRLVSNLL